MQAGFEMNFCRRCGSCLTQMHGHVFACENGHTIYANASPAVGIVLYNDKHEVLVLERGIEPGKGKLDAPGGFCAGAETAEAAIAREVMEEINLTPEDYETLQFVLTGIDQYELDGESGSVLSVMFCARLTTDKTPVAADDAETVTFMPIGALDLEKVYFPTVREAFHRVRQDLDNAIN